MISPIVEQQFLRLAQRLFNSTILSATPTVSVEDINSTQQVAQLTAINTELHNLLIELENKLDATDVLLSQMHILKDGVVTAIQLDTLNPYSHTPLPVVITDVTGTANVTITAGDISVGIKHNGTDPSSVKIGDGTDLMVVNADGSINTTITATDLDIRNLTSNDIITVTGGVGQTFDVKVTLDNESVVITNSDIATVAGAVSGNEMQVDIITIPSITETPSKITVTLSGTIPSGTRSVTLITSPDFTGSMLGDTAQASSAYSYTASGNNTLGIIDYVITTGSIEILKTV